LFVLHTGRKSGASSSFVIDERKIHSLLKSCFDLHPWRPFHQDVEADSDPLEAGGEGWSRLQSIQMFCAQFSEEPAFSLPKNAARGVTIWKLKSFGRLAQRLEHPVYTRKVVRSNRTLPTN
jgi:hypothetical protein